MTKTTPCARQRDRSSILQTVAPLALFTYVDIRNYKMPQSVTSEEIIYSTKSYENIQRRPLMT